MPGIGFIRVKLLQADMSPGPEPDDPFLAINVKEAMDIPGQLCVFICYGVRRSLIIKTLNHVLKTFLCRIFLCFVLRFFFYLGSPF